MAKNSVAEQTEMNTTSISLIQKDIQYMSKGIDEIKTSMKDLKDGLMQGFVTIEQFKNLQQEVWDLQNLKDWAMKIIFGAIILAVLAVIGIGVGTK